MLFFRAYALLQGDYALLQSLCPYLGNLCSSSELMPFFRAIFSCPSSGLLMIFSSELMSHEQTSTDVYIFWLNRDIALYNQLLPHTRWKMVHANLRGKLELIWLYGDPIEGWHSEQGHHIDWRPMHAEVALKVESAFNSWTTHVYRKVGNHLYDFCAMCQVNMITGTRRPIRRLFRDHDAR